MIIMKRSERNGVGRLQWICCHCCWMQPFHNLSLKIALGLGCLNRCWWINSHHIVLSFFAVIEKTTFSWKLWKSVVVGNILYFNAKKVVWNTYILLFHTTITRYTFIIYQINQMCVYLCSIFVCVFNKFNKWFIYIGKKVVLCCCYKCTVETMQKKTMELNLKSISEITCGFWMD